MSNEGGLWARVVRRRTFWLFAGVLLLPTLGAIKCSVWPNPRQAAGLFPGWTEEHRSQHSNGDYQYSFKFSGDQERFHRYARRLGFSNDMLNPEGTEYREAGEGEDRSRGIRFTALENSAEGTIEYSSGSW